MFQSYPWTSAGWIGGGEMSSYTTILIIGKSKLHITCRIFLCKSKGQQQSDQLCARWGKDLPCGMDDLRMHLKKPMRAAEKTTHLWAWSFLLYLVKGEKEAQRTFPTSFPHIWQVDAIFGIESNAVSLLPFNKEKKKKTSFIMTIDLCTSGSVLTHDFI